MSETLRERLADVKSLGALRWIGVRPAHESPMTVLERATVLAGRGIEGDRVVRGARPDGKRHVTLIQHEHLPVIAALTGRDRLAPEALRRNLVVSGINLLALRGLHVAIGDAVILEVTGPCEPCAKMDAALGEGGFHAMRGHGGVTARVITGGAIALGDPVRVARCP